LLISTQELLIGLICFHETCYKSLLTLGDTTENRNSVLSCEFYS
jgi:hypothetical protein